MHLLLAMLLATTVAPGSGPTHPRGCTPPRSGQRVPLMFSGSADLAEMAAWARTSLCVDYTFAPALAARRLPDYVHMALDGADAVRVFEMLLHTMNLRVDGHGSTRTIVATGDDPGNAHVAELAAQIKKIDATHYEVGRDVLNVLLAANGNGWVKVTPQIKDGKVNALRLSSIKADGIPARLGFANEDLLKSVNGLALTDPAAALEAYAKTRTADRVTFGVSRTGRDVAIEWRLVGARAPTVPAAPMTTARDPDPVVAEITEQIARADDTHYTITRAALKKTLETGALTRAMRVVPESKDGQQTAVRLFGVRPTSVPGALGIRNGDIVVSVNGLPMANPDNALQIYAKAATIDAFKLSIVRLGQPVAIEVKVK